MEENKNIFVALLVALLTISAYFVADTVDAVIGKSLDAAPRFTGPMERSRPRLEPRRELSDYNAILERGFFGDGTKPSAGGTASQQSSVYSLIGTVEGEVFSGAVLQDEEGTQNFYRIRTKLPDGSRIVKVRRDTIILKKPGGERVELKVIDDTEIVKVRKPPARRRGKVRPGGVKKVGKDKWMVDERQLTGGMENLNQLLTQARALPYLENGKTAGFRLSEIVPGSMFEKIGLLNGDVIKRVNSQDLNNPGEFFKLYQSLKDEKNVTVDVLRNGQHQTLNYEIR